MRKKNFQPIVLRLSLLLLVWCLVSPSGYGADEDCPGQTQEDNIQVAHEKVACKRFITARITTTATPAQIWSSILEEPRHDKNLIEQHIVSKVDTKSVIQERFVGVPFFGDTTCVIQTDEVPGISLHYKLLESNHIKDLEACWNIHPLQGAKTTVVELRCWTQIKYYCPDILLERAIVSRLKRRLTFVKQYAENLQADTIAYQSTSQH